MTIISVVAVFFVILIGVLWRASQILARIAASLANIRGSLYHVANDLGSVATAIRTPKTSPTPVLPVYPETVRITMADLRHRYGVPIGEVTPGMYFSLKESGTLYHYLIVEDGK